MSSLIQILLFFFTWFNLSATTTISKVVLPNYETSYLKAEFLNQGSEVKIGIQNFARSGIPARGRAQSENSFSQKAIFWESSVLEETRARMSVVVVNGTGNVTDLLAKFNNLSITEAKNLYSQLIKSEIIGSKTAVTQSTILAEINASNSLVNPYSFTHSIDDMILNQEALFVRVHNSWNPNTPWLISIEEFRTFANQDEMIKKLALPILDNTGNIVKPIEISIVKVPVGTKVRQSIARPQDWPGQGHQSGGAIQFEIRDNPAIPKSWFKPMGNFSDYLN